MELLDANEKQKLDKEYKLGEQAKQEQEEYQRIIEKQIKDLENERRKEEEKRKIRYDHNHELRFLYLFNIYFILFIFRRQIKEKEESAYLNNREQLEEGRKLKQKQESEIIRLSKIRENKIDDLKNLNINSKYIVDLSKFKIK